MGFIGSTCTALPSLMQQLPARDKARMLPGLMSSTISHSASASRVRPSAMM